MIRIPIPGYRTLELEHLVLDFNGTLAFDGRLLPGVKKILQALARQLSVHVLTADTFGRARSHLAGVDCTVFILAGGDQAVAKRDYVRKLVAERCVSIGNGRNDRLMLAVSALGIAVILNEGACAATTAGADVVCTSIENALDLLRQPLRLTATLRS